jgi:hypothetical protein
MDYRIVRWGLLPLAVSLSILACDHLRSDDEEDDDSNGTSSSRFTALWVDDFKTDGIDDCQHDAIISEIVNYAIEPHLPAGQSEIHQWSSRMRVGECGEGNDVQHFLDLEQMSRYDLLFWNVSPSPTSAMGALTNASSPLVAQLHYYVRNGGHLIFWGMYDSAAVLGDFFPADRYIPLLPQFPETHWYNFSSSDFLWAPMDLKTGFDRAGRERGPGARQMDIRCSGIIALEATDQAVSEGFPAGVVDPTGYGRDRTAIWYYAWDGWHNAFGWPGANAMIGNPPLFVPGLDTLYTYVSNSWAWKDDLVEVCGLGFFSPLEGKPVVVRYDDPRCSQGKIVWIGTPLYIFAEDHIEDLKTMMRRLTDWVFEE